MEDPNYPPMPKISCVIRSRPANKSELAKRDENILEFS